MTSLPVVPLVAPVLGSSVVVPLVTVTAVWVKGVPPPMVTHFGLLVGCWKKRVHLPRRGFLGTFWGVCPIFFFACFPVLLYFRTFPSLFLCLKSAILIR